MQSQIQVRCSSCGESHCVDSQHGGSIGICSRCRERIILPIPCPDQLLTWARSAEWRRLYRFINLSGASGHTRETINEFIEICEKRRWAEEDAQRLRDSQTGEVPSLRQRQWRNAEITIRRQSTIDYVRKLSPVEFERLVADIFSSQGYAAQAVGGTADDGIDVQVLDRTGQLWAIAQCKLYAAHNRIGASHIRDFAGAFGMVNAEQGFFFTTSSFTRAAQRTAKCFPWLRLYDCPRLIAHIEKLGYEIG